MILLLCLTIILLVALTLLAVQTTRRSGSQPERISKRNCVTNAGAYYRNNHARTAESWQR